MNNMRDTLKRKALVVIMLAVPCVSAGAAAAEERCPEATKIMREALESKGAESAQIEQLKKATELCPSLADAHYNYALFLAKAQRLEEASKALENALSLRADETFLVLKGQLRLFASDVPGAKDVYEQVLKTDRDNIGALRGLAVVSERSGDLVQAEALLRQAIQVAPGDARLYYSLGVVLEKGDRTSEAIVSYKTATQKQSNYAEAQAALARALAREKRFPEALSGAEAAVLLQPSSPMVWSTKASILERLGRYSEARSSYEKALTLEPAVTRHEIGIATCDILSGDSEAGLTRLRQLVARNPQDAPIHAALGWALLRVRQLDEGEAELRKAIELNNSLGEAHNNLGVLLDLRGDTTMAAEQFRKAVERDPDLAEAKDNLGRMKP